MLADELQDAIYSKLTGDTPLMALITGVYVDVEQPDFPEEESVFPYITFGDDSISNWDTKTNNGASAICQIDTWSRTNNLIEAKQIGKAIYRALHKQDLTFATAEHVNTVVESQSYSKDPDGKSKHGITLVRVIYDQL
jgi:hypothetical protein